MGKAIVLAAALVSAGCSHSGLVSRPLPVLDRAQVVDDRYGYMSCNLDFMRNTFGTRLKDADRVFLYALMSSNAYDDKSQYDIPGWTRVGRLESSSGLGLDEWVRDGSNPVDKVVAFRGTNFKSIKDWKTNAGFIEPWQHREAYDYVAQLRQAEPATRLRVTGHSLGGAIALNLSQRFDELPAIAFNSSPRAFFASQGKLNDRILAWETGEFLNVVRRPWLRVRMRDAERMRFNFIDYNWYNSLKPIAEHGMYPFSRALLISAVANGSGIAHETFKRNIDRAQAMALDPKLCGPLLGDATVSNPAH